MSVWQARLLNLGGLRRRKAALHGWIITNELDIVAFRVMDIERAPVDPVVIGELEFAAECFKPGTLGLEIFSGDREGEMIDGRFGRAQTGVARLVAPVKKSQNLSVSPVAGGDLEESRIWKPPHQLQADDILIKGLHCVEVIHAQSNFT